MEDAQTYSFPDPGIPCSAVVRLDAALFPSYRRFPSRAATTSARVPAALRNRVKLTAVLESFALPIAERMCHDSRNQP